MESSPRPQTVHIAKEPEFKRTRTPSKRKLAVEFPVTIKVVKEEQAPVDVVGEEYFNDSLEEQHSILNAQIADDVFIDTQDLCARVAYELKQHSIPQTVFAEKILCRSQGTLSDLLRNPRPWNEMKSGKQTFRRMFNWLQQPLHVRLTILDMYGGPQVANPRVPERQSRTPNSASKNVAAPPMKKTRFVFTEVQKRTLQAIFLETQRPSREMQETIAAHLGLDASTVANFFMNSRRRSRTFAEQEGNAGEDLEEDEEEDE